MKGQSRVQWLSRTCFFDSRLARTSFSFVAFVILFVHRLAADSPDDGQWLMPARDFQGTRFSGLVQIDTTTVTNLKVAWTFSTGVNRGQEAAPIVVSNSMYVVTPYPNILYALDLD